RMERVHAFAGRSVAQVGDGLDGKGWTLVREEALPVRPRGCRRLGRAWKVLEARDTEVVDQVRAGSQKVRHRGLEKSHDARVGTGLQLESLSEGADARAAESVALEKRGVRRRDVIRGHGGRRIGRINS